MPIKAQDHTRAAWGSYRLAVGAALATAFAYGAKLPLPFLTIVLTILLLGAPAPLPLRGAVVILALLGLSGVWGLLLGALLAKAPVIGLAVMLLAVGGAAGLSTKPKLAVVGTFFLIGSLVVAALARQSSAAGVAVVQSLVIGALAAIIISRSAHIAFPAVAPVPGPPAPSADPGAAGRAGARASLIMLPPILLALSDPGRFMLLLMKGATLAQQVQLTRTRAMARELVESTFLGGGLALAIWVLLRPWPSLFFFAALVGFAALLVGRRFYGIVASRRGPQHWQAVLVTAIILIGPAVEDSASGDDIGRESLIRFTAFVVLAGYVALIAWLLDGRRAAFGQSRAGGVEAS